MNYTDLVRMVSDRTKVKTEDGLRRIGEEINLKYREVVSSIGINTTSRTTATATTTIGNRTLVFGTTALPVEKIIAVYDATVTPARVLDEASFDALRNTVAGTDPPQYYAIQIMGDHTVSIFLSSVPATAYVLTADVYANQTSLSGTMTPTFPEDFHDMLVDGAVAIELEIAEKYQAAQRLDTKFLTRLADLRYYIAKSAYRDVQQGQTSNTRVGPRV